MNYEISFAENPLAEELQILSDGIDQFTQAKMGLPGNTQLTFFLRDDTGTLVGGVHGNYGGSWLYISTLWVSDQVRDQGYGSQLMQQIEEAAIKGGCANVYLDTFSYQAPDFYKKLGYILFGELEDFPVGYSRCFFRKRLVLS